MGLAILAAVLRQIAITLFARRRQPARWLFAAAAVPMLIVAAMAMCDFTPVPYLVLAGICVLQAVFPTLAGWGVSVGFYAIGAVVYLYALATGGAHGNAVPILLIMVFCAGVTAVLVWARPRRIGDA